MSRILAAVAGLNPEAEPAAIDQLFDVAKKFKPLPVPDAMEPPTEYHMDAEGSYPIPLDQCDTDPSYQRPLDREKVAAMKLDKAWEKQPIHVNMDGGTYWIIDGQHRAEAARQSGVKEVHAFVDFMPSQSEAKHETGVMAKTAFTPHPDHGKSVPAHIKSYPALKDHLVSQSAKHGGAWVAENTFGEATQYHYKNRSSVPAHFRGESHHHDGLAVNGKWQGWTHSQIVRDQNSWGKTASDLRVGDAYEGHVLPSMEPDLIFTLEGLGAYHEVAKVAPYGWHGKCYVVRCSTGTITYVPYSAVEKDAGAILTLPERGLLRFDGMAEDEVQYVLKTIDARRCAGPPAVACPARGREAARGGPRDRGRRGDTRRGHRRAHVACRVAVDGRWRRRCLQRADDARVLPGHLAPSDRRGRLAAGWAEARPDRPARLNPSPVGGDTCR
jgi:hypothetical protein